MLGAVKSLFKSGKPADKVSAAVAHPAETEDADSEDYSLEDIGSTDNASSDTSGGGMKATGEATDEGSNSSETENDKFSRLEDQIKKQKAAGTTASELMNKFGQNVIELDSDSPESTTQSAAVAQGSSAAPTQNDHGADIPDVAPSAGPSVVVGPSVSFDNSSMGRAQQLLLEKLGWAGITMCDLDHVSSFVQDQSKGSVEGFVKQMVESPEFLNQVKREYAPIMAGDHPELGMSAERNVISTLNTNGVGLNRSLAAALLGSVELNFGGMTFDASHPANTPTGRISPDLASNSLTPAAGGAGVAPKEAGINV